MTKKLKYQTTFGSLILSDHIHLGCYSYPLVGNAYHHELVLPHCISMEQKHTKFLSGRAALEHWEVPNLRGVLEPEDHKVMPEFVVFTDQSVHVPQGLAIRTCRIPGASKYTQDGVCTLPLVFLQVARDYEIHQLIYLAIQMISYRDRKPPLVTLRALRSCAEELVGHHGRRKVMRALKYAEEGSRSPMESLLYMFLSLPNCLGGCGFRGMKFNHKIVAFKSNQTYYADLYLPSEKLVIEYNSYQHHNNAQSFSGDSVRTMNLQAEGYKVVIVTPAQLSEIRHFETLAYTLAKILNKRIRIRARKFFPGYRAMRELLRNAGKRLSSSYEKVMIYDVPQFPGIRAAYALYETALERWRSISFPCLSMARSPG